MSDVKSTEQGASTVTCGGCGKEFRGARGLTSHQNHRNAAAGCKPAARMADADLISARPEQVVEEPNPIAIQELRARRQAGETGQAFANEVIAARDAEMENCDSPQRPLPEAVQEAGRTWLDRLIADRRIYTTIPADVRTVLMKVDGIDKWAVRVHHEDAAAITATSDNSTLVKVTKHEAGGETLVTDFYWCISGAPRIRVTEKFAV